MPIKVYIRLHIAFGKTAKKSTVSWYSKWGSILYTIIYFYILYYTIYYNIKCTILYTVLYYMKLVYNQKYIQNEQNK